MILSQNFVSENKMILAEISRTFSFMSLKCIIFFSFDGGNSKLIVTLTVIDLDNPTDEGSQFMSNGRRAQLVIARGDYAPENLHNWRIILSKLRIFDESS